MEPWQIKKLEELRKEQNPEPEERPYAPPPPPPPEEERPSRREDEKQDHRGMITWKM